MLHQEMGISLTFLFGKPLKRKRSECSPGAAGKTALTSLSKLTRLVLNGEDGYGIAEEEVKARSLATTALSAPARTQAAIY